ncbi:glycoside hydrolase family 25 protein [Solitalea lacus]|uniref:glycoside hydrolase family 25 protein n=1 Tax=Solitalea lacus TaxID=2911172 RepID=UPI001EDA6CC8|nr:GH25 family lysozyme [Solitalea lacus]UKJ09095.1 glycoside hydrolase family 25 protein [Solitalea lacus]
MTFSPTRILGFAQGQRIRVIFFFLSVCILLLIPKHSDTAVLCSPIRERAVYKNHLNYRFNAYGDFLLKRYSVHGIDVSRYQNKIDWKKVKELNKCDNTISFVYIKASEGEDDIDPMFSYNWLETRKANLKRGAYHYFKPKRSGKKQAKLFLATVNHFPGDLPPVVDVEEKGKMKLKPFQKNLREFIVEVEKKVGEKPVIYCSYRFYQDFIKNGFKDYPCWIANYHQTKLLGNGNNWHFWQHTDTGRVKGIIGRVDLNTFNGSMDDLEKLCIKSI